MDYTARKENDFGSAGIYHPIMQHILMDQTNRMLQEDSIKPYNIWLSPDPYIKQMNIQIETKHSNQPTLGVLLQDTPNQHRVQLTGMEKGTPDNRIPKWRSTLKQDILLKVNNNNITTIDKV
jgi:hypothetical protein